MIEQRQIPRWQIGEKAKMKLREQNWEGKCNLEDLNLKGLQVSLKEQLPIEDALGMQLVLSDGLNIHVQAKVCWKRQVQDRFYYGLEFAQIKDQHKDDISQYLFKNYNDQVKEFWWPKDGIKES